MNSFKKIAFGALALTLAIGLGGSVLAQNDTGDVTVEITSTGVLSVEISDLDYGSFEYSLVTRTPTGTITIDASDMRGTASGWHVTLKGDDFSTGGATPLSFPISNLVMPVGSVNHSPAATGHASNALPVASALTPVSTSEQTVLTAVPGTGAGGYSNSRAGTQLTIPGGTLVGEYESSLTVTISGDQP